MSNVIPPVAIDSDNVAILLDVDGTILDLAPTPQSVWVPPSLCESLTLLGNRVGGALALVSGRPTSDLDGIFSPLRLPTIGGHGAEMRLGHTPELIPRAPLNARLRRTLAGIAQEVPGVLVEDKGYSLALHYRSVPEKEVVVVELAGAACIGMKGVELLPGKLMLEIKQRGFNKGSAVRELMTHRPFAGRRPIFIGDDVTDRDVFAVMPEFDGIAVSVGDLIPRVKYHFDQPSDVRSWLSDLSRNHTFATS